MHKVWLLACLSGFMLFWHGLQGQGNDAAGLAEELCKPGLVGHKKLTWHGKKFNLTQGVHARQANCISSPVELGIAHVSHSHCHMP